MGGEGEEVLSGPANGGGKSDEARMQSKRQETMRHATRIMSLGVADPHFRVDQDRQGCRSPETTRITLHRATGCTGKERQGVSARR
jgi:hypothetical protein